MPNLRPNHIFLIFVVSVIGVVTYGCITFLMMFRPLFPLSNGELMYWTITEARIEPDGTGQARVENYDSQKKAEVSLEIRTRDFGQTWSVVKP